MFQPEPICILKQGRPLMVVILTSKSLTTLLIRTTQNSTRHASMKITGTGEKLGSVLSVEKRGDELWAVIKPNSRLLSNVERDQFLHTSCEYTADFAKTGKAYLTGFQP